MCKTISVLDVLNKSVKELQGRMDEVSNGMSEMDKLQEDLLHLIESEEKMNASRGYELARAIREVRIHRRELKNEYRILQDILPKIKPMNINIALACNRAKELEKKQIKISELGIESYNPRIMDIKGDIRLEVRKLLLGGE